MKIIGLHALSHTEDDKDHQEVCAVCEHAVLLDLTPNITPNLQYEIVKNTAFVFNITSLIIYKTSVSNTFINTQLFSRPPPYFV